MNQSSYSRSERTWKGFTLIELLIVIAIIAILALIAVPNFLEAQTRAKIARVQADMRTVVDSMKTYTIDTGALYIPDGNDCGVNWNWTFQQETGVPPDMQWRTGFPGGLRTLTKYKPFTLLTTPISYMTSVPTDAFSQIMPFSYDTRGEDCPGNRFEYNVVIAAGPDKTLGDWYRGVNANGNSLPYSATNGTVSPGDYWRAVVVNNNDLYNIEYGGFFIE